MADWPPVSLPAYKKWERLADEDMTTYGPQFADGGIDTFSPGVSFFIRRWQITFELLTLAEAAIIDAWDALNRRSVAYNFTDRDSTVYGGVKTESYERGHGSQYATTQWRTITFVDRP